MRIVKDRLFYVMHNVLKLFKRVTGNDVSISD